MLYKNVLKVLSIIWWLILCCLGLCVLDLFCTNAFARSFSFLYLGRFPFDQNSEISGPKLNGTVRIPGKVFENLGIRFQCTLFDGIFEIIENLVFHSQEMSGLVSLPSVSSRGHLNNNKVSPSMPCVAEHVTSNSGKRSDAFHFTSENSKNLNR